MLLMKKLLKFFFGFILLLVTALIGLLSYAKFALPNVGAAPEIKVEMTPENIARGEYLAKYVFD